MNEPEMTNAERWLDLRARCEKTIAEFAMFEMPEDDYCTKLRRLLPLITELEQRPKLRWLMPRQHHAVVELFWPETSERAWENVAYFYEKEPELFSVTRTFKGQSQPTKIRYEVVFLGTMDEAITFVEKLAEEIQPLKP
ncbi:hypothetical protein [Armatimonas rosea]|uniref:Uncharacterized protein n=1 Tax=Armatimonas rosea TaxID=685828 RepID=A0A7W9SN66_ARMRO|nr:hypothetical protein [Armatimonas rosea]MBB6049702.1 hypothetical protein [Armatimonas rosea]